MKETAVQADAQNLAGPSWEIKSFPWAWMFVFCVVAALLVFAPTLLIPFYISDDADAYRTADQVLSFIQQGDWLKRFEMSASERRNFPGFWYYHALRVHLLGKSPLAWHVVHMLMYATIGVLVINVCWRATRSLLPGAAAFVLLITTGEAIGKSNWDNLINLATFEPPLTLLWLASTCLLVSGAQMRNKVVAGLVFGAGFCLLTWSVFFKETSFLFVGAVTGFVLLILLLRWKWGGLALERKAMVAVPLLGALIIASSWGLFVYIRLPKDDAYAGVGSLGLTPASLWETYKKYRDIIIGQSDYLVPFGLGLMVVRLAILKIGRLGWTTADYWQLSILVAGLAQLLTLLIWPYTEGRYVQPAYLCLLMVAFNEFYFLGRKLWETENPAGRHWHFWAAMAGLLFVLWILSVGFEGTSFVSITKYGLMVLAWVGAIVVFAGLAQRPVLSMARAGFVAALVPALVITLLQSLNVRAYILTDYALTEGMRFKLVDTIAKTARPNGSVFWVVDGGNEGHAWASGIYLAQFMDRGDLKVGPASWVITQGIPKRGDLLIPYLNNVDLSSAGEGQLARLDHETGGMVSRFRNTVDVRDFVTRMLFYPSSISADRLKLESISLRVPMYRVTSNTWVPGATVRENFYPGGA